MAFRVKRILQPRCKKFVAVSDPKISGSDTATNFLHLVFVLSRTQFYTDHRVCFPGTPERWRLYEEELSDAWRRVCEAATRDPVDPDTREPVGSDGREPVGHETLARSVCDLAYFW